VESGGELNVETGGELNVRRPAAGCLAARGRSAAREVWRGIDLAFCITVGDHPILALSFSFGVCNLPKMHNFKCIMVGDALILNIFIGFGVLEIFVDLF